MVKLNNQTHVLCEKKFLVSEGLKWSGGPVCCAQFLTHWPIILKKPENQIQVGPLTNVNISTLFRLIY